MRNGQFLPRFSCFHCINFHRALQRRSTPGPAQQGHRPIIPKYARPIILKNEEVLAAPSTANPDPVASMTIKDAPETMPQNSIIEIEVPVSLDGDSFADLIVFDSEQDIVEMDPIVHTDRELVDSVDETTTVEESSAGQQQAKNNEMISKTTTGPQSKHDEGSSVVRRNYNPSPEELKLESIMIEMKLFTCRICETDARTLFDLQKHVRANHDLKQYKICCDKNIPSTKGFLMLYNHIRTHLDADPFKCTSCGIDLMNADALKFHMDEYHPKDTPSHVCEHCGKDFRSKNQYDWHLRTHTDMVKCKYCGNGRSAGQDGSLFN